MSGAPGTPMRRTLMLRTLMFRTTAVLGAALVTAIIALYVILRPFLAGSFEDAARTLNTERAARAQADARAVDDAAEAVARAASDRAWESALAAIHDAPLELSTPQADAVRAALASAVREAEDRHRASITSVRAAMAERTHARVAAQAESERAESAAKAREFGRTAAARTTTGLLALLAVLFLVHGWLLWRWVLAPLRRMADATQDVARGDLSVRLPVAGDGRDDDEVGRLSRSFNQMTESLGRARSELEGLNATLEQRVRTKTEEVAAKERALRHADKMAALGTLAGGVSHEFNNLLGGIQGCAEDAAAESDPAELKATLEMIERTARRGISVSQNLLRFARPSEGARRSVDVAEMFRDVAALIEPEAVRNRVKVTVECGAVPPLTADASGIHQVILNLATNALHAMKRDGGSLTLSAESSAGETRLRVADTGTGIRAEHRDRLFEPFFTTRPEGTGLGLSVSWGIVQSHGGRITVESEPGRGSAFTVTLPHDPPPPDSSDDSPATAGTGDER